jgi:hypothetical protein
MDTNRVAQMIQDGVSFTRLAHIELPRSPKDAVRFHDRSTPYIIHPIWCAMTIMTETTLEEAFRLKGCQALMWHDVLEDTHAELPTDISDELLKLIQDMSFASFDIEKDLVWQKPKEIRLFKLYDKTSNLLDASHYSVEKWNSYAEFTRRLVDDVEINYGKLNIVKIARAIAIHKQ